MIIKFLDSAQEEYKEAIIYYNNQKEGLGAEFAEEVKKTIERIIQYPEAWLSLSQRTRRCQTNKFPYGIIYQVRNEILLIVAVMHLHRNPRSWRSRIHNGE